MKFLSLHLPRVGGGLRFESADLRIPFPRCAYCRREVDVLEAHLDGGVVALVARCHFDTEEVRVPRSFLGPGAKVEILSAFTAAYVTRAQQRAAERR